MTEQNAPEDVLKRARAAGLHKAVERFPDEVQAAAHAAAHVRNAFASPSDATIEPWPPMRAKAGG